MTYPHGCELGESLVDKPLSMNVRASENQGCHTNRSPETRTMTVTETELGLERRCTNCGDYWPLDGEFFHRNTKGVGGFLSRCRACFAELRGRRDLSRRVSNIGTISLLRALGVPD